MRLPPRLWKLLHSRKLRIGLAISPIALAALIALAYPVAGWAGRRAWEKQNERFHALGLATTREEYCRVGSRAETDLFQHPAMQAEMARSGADSLRTFHEATAVFHTDGKPSDLSTWVSPAAPTSLEGARQWLAAHADLEAHWRELRPAFQRTDLVLPDPSFTQSNSGPALFKKIADFGASHAVAEMAMGHREEAFEDVCALLDLQRLLFNARPLLISDLVALLVGYTVESAIAEGIVRDVWDEENLAAFEKRLAALDPQVSTVNALRGELAWGETQKSVLPGPIDWEATWTTDTTQWLPRLYGLWRGFRPIGLEWLEEVQGRDGLLDEGVLSHGKPRESFSRAEFQSWKTRAAAAGSGGTIFLKSGTKVYLDHEAHNSHTFATASQFALTGEANLALLRTGIAVERFRLRNGGPPPRSLTQLIPGYVPALLNDPFAEAPLSYRVEPDGTTLLWSYGPDCKDDRGGKGDLIWRGFVPSP